MYLSDPCCKRREGRLLCKMKQKKYKNRVNEKAKWYSLYMIAYSHVNQFKHGQ